MSIVSHNLQQHLLQCLLGLEHVEVGEYLVQAPAVVAHQVLILTTAQLSCERESCFYRDTTMLKGFF